MTNINAKIIADSVAPSGKRITTFELEFHRFLLPEFNTHRMISKNSASSRAIPVKTMLDNIRENPAIPSHWGKNQAGMQANEECDELILTKGGDINNLETFAFNRTEWWKNSARIACFRAERMAEAGYHKQIVNRLTEPFQMIKVVATATEWDNFFWLRKHADAQPEIRILAEKMWEARKESNPEVLQAGEWHTPYVSTVRFNDGVRRYCSWKSERVLSDGTEEVTFNEITLEQALKVSASMCAQVSYRKADDTLEKALMIYDRLVESKPVHASPLEHQATPMSEDMVHCMYLGFEGVTALHKELGAMSGNFAGWVQFRQTIENNTCWNYKE